MCASQGYQLLAKASPTLILLPHNHVSAIDSRYELLSCNYSGVMSTVL